MSAVIDIASWVSILLGSFFVLVAAIGIVRMPDVYTRLHAASVGETMGVGLLCLGMILQSPHWLVTAKIITIAAVIFFSAPVAGHALAQAAMTAGIRPRVKDPEACAKAIADDRLAKPVGMTDAAAARVREAGEG